MNKTLKYIIGIILIILTILIWNRRGIPEGAGESGYWKPLEGSPAPGGDIPEFAYDFSYPAIISHPTPGGTRWEPEKFEGFAALMRKGENFLYQRRDPIDYTVKEGDFE